MCLSFGGGTEGTGMTASYALHICSKVGLSVVQERRMRAHRNQKSHMGLPKEARQTCCSHILLNLQARGLLGWLLGRLLDVGFLGSRLLGGSRLRRGYRERRIGLLAASPLPRQLAVGTKSQGRVTSAKVIRWYHFIARQARIRARSRLGRTDLRRIDPLSNERRSLRLPLFDTGCGPRQRLNACRTVTVETNAFPGLLGKRIRRTTYNDWLH